MTLNTFVAGNPGSIRALADSVRELGAGVEEDATGFHRARSDSEAGWEGQASEAFRGVADRNARAADELARLHAGLDRALQVFADDLTTVKARMEQAKSVALEGELRVLGDAIFPPAQFTAFPPEPRSGHMSAAESEALTKAAQEYERVAALHAKQEAAYREAEATINDARAKERAAHDQLLAALKSNSSGLDVIGERGAWEQAAATASTPVAMALAGAAARMEDWAANATKGAFEQAMASGPAAVHGMWASLTTEQQADLISRYPQMVGNTNGVPTVARDKANRALLAFQRMSLVNKIKELRDKWAKRRSGTRGDELPEDSSQLEQMEQSLGGLDRLEQTLNSGDKYLIALNSTAGDRGQTIVASGNPDTADHVATLVPGTFYDLHDAADYVERNDQMLARAHEFAPGQKTAAVMYGNFEAPPDLPNASFSGYAEHAEQGLSDFQQGMRITHDGPPSHNTVIGHSYGSTTVGYAARDHGLHADDLAFYGSPGVGVERATDLHVNPDHVWVGTSQNDAIRYVPSADPLDWIVRNDHTRYGLEPYDPRFGANTLPTDPTAGHTDYWDRKPSLDGMAKLVVGQPERMPR